MKKILLTITAMSLCLSSLSAQNTVEIGGIVYSIFRNSIHVSGKKATGDVVIRETVTINKRDYTIREISSNAFKDNVNISSVVLPNTVRSIGNSAFQGCKKLTKINIPSMVTYIGSNAFSQTGFALSPDNLMYIDKWLVGYGYVEEVAPNGKITKKMQKPKGDVVVKDSTVGIAPGTFQNCPSMTSLSIPASVSFFRGNFTGCKMLKSIVIDEKNKLYDSRDNCNAIVMKNTNTLMAGCSNTTIPNSVEIIYSNAFGKGATPASIVIPNGVKKIHRDAFKNCEELMEFEIPASIESIGDGAFEGTGWLKSQPDGLLYKNGWLLGYKGATPNGKQEIQAGTKHIVEGAFAGCEGIEEISLPESLMEIPSDAFYRCKGLKKINIPKSVKSIGTLAFYECSALNSVKIPEGVVKLGDFAFQKCTSLKSINIPASMKEIHLQPFDGSEWYDKQPDGIIYFDNWLLGWKGKKLAGRVVIKEGTRNIGGSGLSGCDKITSVVIPNTVLTIGSWAFHDCASLATINIPSSVKSVASFAFEGTKWLQNHSSSDAYLDGWLIGIRGKQSKVTIRPGTKAIAKSVFSYCESLESVTIPPSVKYIDDDAFLECSGLKEVRISNLEAWKRLKFGNEMSNPTYYTKSLTVNGKKITSW